MDREQLRRRAEHTICEGCEARDLLIGRLEARCARYREALELIASEMDPKVHGTRRYVALEALADPSTEEATCSDSQ